MLAIPNAIYRKMCDSSTEAAPLEACGLLAGDGARVTEFYELTNTDASGEHYSMSPEEQFGAVKDMRGKYETW